MMRKRIRKFYSISFSLSGSMGIPGEKSKNETQWCLAREFRRSEDSLSNSKKVTHIPLFSLPL
jgi:hypothetical protein